METLLKVGALAGSSSGRLRVEYRRSPASRWDLRVISSEPELLASAVALLEESGGLETVAANGEVASIRFASGFVERQIQACAANPELLSGREILRGKRAIVQFIDPNSTKAMHLGHLYEAVLGHALASLLESLGADVRRYCFVSDISRSVCEAMAGYELFGDGKRPEDLGEKPDHTIGRLYALYAQSYYERHPEELQNDDPVRRETGLVGDHADKLMQAYVAGDAGVRELWGTVRGWVLDGQFATLDRLKVRLDVVQYGSEMDAIIDRLISLGLGLGVLTKDPDGSVVFHSGKKEYSTVVITRPDGFPTEHARQIGQMISVADRCDSLDWYYSLMGMEWKPAWTIYEDILRRCGYGRYHDVVVPVCHGMVMVQGSKMKSSKGAVILADDLLDDLEHAREVRALAARSEGSVEAADVADIVLKCFFLTRRMGKDLNFAWKQLMSAAENPGWDIAGALCGTSSPRADSPPGAPTLFFTLLDYRRSLLHSATDLDPGSQVRFLQRVARDAASGTLRTDDPLSAALFRTLMRLGLKSIGISTEANGVSERFGSIEGWTSHGLSPG